MWYRSERHRKPTRAAGHDYSQPGWYFVTICTQYRAPLFGEIIDGVNHLNPAGNIIVDQWRGLPSRFSNVRIDDFIVMPNHLHGLVIIDPVPDGQNRVSLSRVVGAFKSLTTNAYSRGVVQHDWLPFEGQLWQRSFHDQIIRS